MGAVSIKNNTIADINVRITREGDSGNDTGSIAFYTIKPGHTEKWERKWWQVAFVRRDVDGKSESFTVVPDNSYAVN
ncbi:hypothetical protein L210DRAFT_950157 [Boletus edulis BED1]|uniref:Uncharacterized protein n=1 Tax=Boletus edulis BED1 TaxID=1328754 RepID=A0AAD4G6A8_BOLED|nr:hypothetical protein L210DRAFT_950157 [Boletus edulis BED1]